MNPTVGQTVNINAPIASGVAPGQAQYQAAAGATKIIGTRNVAGQDYFNIDQTGIGGGTGWVLGSALSSAISGGNTPSSTAPASPGVSAPSTPTLSGVSNPAPDLSGIYQKAYDSAGISDLQAKSNALDQNIADNKAKLNDAVGNVNGNPFYSEGARGGRIKALQLANTAQEQDLTNQKSIIQNQITSARADVNTQLDLATKQFDINSTASQNALSQFNTLLNAGALDNADPADVAQFTSATGLPSSFLQSAITANQEKNSKVSLIQSTDNSGNVTVSSVKVAPNGTLTVIGKQSLGQIDKSNTSGTGQTYEQQQTQWNTLVNNGIAQLQKGIPWGTVWNSIRSQVPANVPNNAIDAALGKDYWDRSGAYGEYAANQGKIPLPVPSGQ